MRDKIEKLKLSLARGSALCGDMAISEMFCDVFGGTGVQIMRFDGEFSISDHWTSVYDPAIESAYLAHFHHCNPKLSVADPGLPVMVDGMILQRDRFRKTEFYDWYTRDAGICDNLVFHVPEGDGSTWAFGVGRRLDRGILEAEDVALARELHPFLAAALSLRDHALRGVPFVEALLAEVPGQASAWLLCDEAGRVLHASERAALAGFRVRRDGGWSVAGPGGSLGSEEAMAAGGPLRHAPWRTTGVPCVEVTPVLGETLLSRRRCFVVRLRPGGPAAVGLTPGERAVAALLLQGLDLRAIAALRGTSYHTVRNQVLALREKTGTRSIAALVAWLARQGLPGPEAREGPGGPGGTSVS
ncbi:helix-turn-helix transcriptional regulator [Oceanicella sp. SM1341]|uniref:helix-turn-helix transcriptional regulator n=1 Tax=Oceanicella sp. SM1341 TaxID=1548889 RepID=UPI0013008429|nr:helix-turn-helix transcriptional regulator [Oceanicella sp. SM1341]